MAERTERGFKRGDAEMLIGNRGYLFFDDPSLARRVFVSNLGAPRDGIYPKALYIGPVEPARIRDEFREIASVEYNKDIKSDNPVLPRKIDEIACKQLVANIKHENQLSAGDISKINKAVTDHLNQKAENVVLVEADYLFVHNSQDMTVRTIANMCENAQGTQGVLQVQMDPEIMETRFYKQMRSVGEIYKEKGR
jgi:hypothetical protein